MSAFARNGQAVADALGGFGQIKDDLDSGNYRFLLLSRVTLKDGGRLGCGTNVTEFRIHAVFSGTGRSVQ